MESGLKLWGILGSSAIVLSNDSPTLVKAAARLAKVVFGSRIQICDGVNDHLEIQAVIDALPAAGGKVLLMDGTYYIEVSLVLDSYQTLEGCGRNTILTTTTAALDIITATGGAGTEKLDIILTNFYIDATAGGVTANRGVFFTYADHSRIIDIWSMRHNGDGINLLTCDDNLVMGCELSYNGTGIILDHSERAIIIGTLLENNSWYTIDAWYAHNSTITGNRLRNNTDEGIIMDYAEGCTVTANTLVGGTTGINLNYATETSVVGNTVEDFDSYCIILSNSHKNTVSGNNIHNSTYRNIELASSDYNIITGNEVHEASREGLRLGVSHHNLIGGNHFHSNSQQTDDTYDNIYLYDSDDNLIGENICRRGVLANKPRYGINISNANCERNRVIGNDLYDSGSTAAINDIGTDTELPSITIPFSDGLDPQDSGYLIDLGGDYARAFTFLNKEVTQVVRMKVYARSVVLEADKMRAEFVIYGGADNEPYTTHNGSVANHPSTSANFAADDIIYWTLTEAGVLALLGDDSVEVKVLHEDAGNGDCATEAYFRTVTIEYV